MYFNGCFCNLFLQTDFFSRFFTEVPLFIRPHHNHGHIMYDYKLFFSSESRFISVKRFPSNHGSPKRNFQRETLSGDGTEIFAALLNFTIVNLQTSSELSNTWITWNETRLSLSEELVLYKIIEQGIKYKSSKNFTENRE